MESSNKYAIGWVQKDTDGYIYRYIQHYLTNEVDINELLSLKTERDIYEKIGKRFKNTDHCNYLDFISDTFFNEKKTEIHYILEHDDHDKYKVRLYMIQKNNKKPILLSYLNDDENDDNDENDN